MGHRGRWWKGLPGFGGEPRPRLPHGAAPEGKASPQENGSRLLANSTHHSFQMLSCNFSWSFQTPPRALHESLADFVPMSCTKYYSPSTKWQLTHKATTLQAILNSSSCPGQASLSKATEKAHLHQIWPKLPPHHPPKTGIFCVYNIQDHSLTAASDGLLSKLLQPLLPRLPQALPSSPCLNQCTSTASLLVVLAGATGLPNPSLWTPPRDFPIDPADLQGTEDACSDLSTLPVPGRYTVISSGISPPPLQETNHSGTDPTHHPMAS